LERIAEEKRDEKKKEMGEGILEAASQTVSNNLGAKICAAKDLR